MPQCDVLVIGGGVAGMRAAIEARRYNLQVALVSKVHPVRSASTSWQGGINAALRDPDGPDSHAADTIVAGQYLNEQDVVAEICGEAPQDIYELDHFGVPFNRDDQGRLAVRPLSGSANARACYVNDFTGLALTGVLWEQALKAGVHLHDEWQATALAVEGGVCTGAIVLDLADGQLHRFTARAVIIATGGYAQAYEPSASPAISTADGIALAYRAGVPLRDMDMLQYTPLVLQGRTAHLSDALLAEGAALSGGSLNAAAIPAERLAKAFPESVLMVKNLAKLKLGTDTVPVYAAVQRGVGGIRVEAQGATAISGLYAAGECASTGFHGANRLSGNTLLESYAMGRRAGTAASLAAKNAPAPSGRDDALTGAEQDLKALLATARGEDTPAKIRHELGALMESKLGAQRTAAGPKEAADAVAALKARHARVGIAHTGKRFNADLQRVLELGALLDTAEAIAASALARGEKQEHIIARTATAGGTMTEREPVTITDWQPKVRA